MSDTPKTDAFLKRFTMSYYAMRSDLVEDKAAALEEFARQLERELEDAERDAAYHRRIAGRPPKGGQGPY